MTYERKGGRALRHANNPISMLWPQAWGPATRDTMRTAKEKYGFERYVSGVPAGVIRAPKRRRSRKARGA